VLDLFAKFLQLQPASEWFHPALLAGVGGPARAVEGRAADLQRRLDDVRRRQDRLLNVPRSSGPDEAVLAVKNTELRRPRRGVAAGV